VPDLVLLRHGESTWNALNLFTGWKDVDLSEKGEEEAREGGRLLAGVEDLDLRIVHTSVLTRAIRTANLALDAAGRGWLPVRRHWRLNERHYGDLQGRDKRQTRELHGDELLKAWRRSYDIRPPELPLGDERDPTVDPRYDGLDPAELPRTECLKDVVERVVPYWEDAIIPDLVATAATGGAVLVAAHGNSIRALRKHLEGISDEAIVGLEIPTGIPYRVILADDLSVQSIDPLGDPEAARAAAEKVARQAG
jgi:2,3-bisphosphoglycerate-dependent phosphoglycerate mutase